MSSLPHEPVSVYSHPYRPELALLRVALGRMGCIPAAVDQITAYAAVEGTTDGAPGLDLEDIERLDWVLEVGCEAVSSTSREWDEWCEPRRGPHYRTTDGAWIADAWEYLTKERGLSLPPVCGGGEDDWPREHTPEERRAFAADVAEWYREHPEG